MKSLRSPEAIQLRIDLLKSRKRENARIIRKQERRLRALQKNS
jgi:hypothetical protein